MQQVVPALRITDHKRSKEFYVDGLGFKVDWEHQFEPNFPVFMQMSKEGISLFLTEHSGDCEVGGLVYIYVADIDIWHANIKLPGINGPKKMDWGTHEFRMKDPDGNTICISTRKDG